MVELIVELLEFHQNTLASGIDVGLGINVGHGKFDKRINVGPSIHMSYVVNNHLNNLHVLSNM